MTLFDYIVLPRALQTLSNCLNSCPRVSIKLPLNNICINKNLNPRVFVPIGRELWEEPFQVYAIGAEYAVKPDGQKMVAPRALVLRPLIKGNEIGIKS